MNRITVLLAEDNKIVREGVRSLLESHADIEVVGEAENGHQAVAMACHLVPHVIIMDIAMPYLNGLEAGRRIRASLPPSTRVLVLSAHNEAAYIDAARALGAAGYLIKHSDGALIAWAIRQVHGGAPFVCPSQPS